MWLISLLLETGNGGLFLGYLSETEIVLLFGICLVVLTIGLRWILNRYDREVTKNGRNEEKIEI